MRGTSRGTRAGLGALLCVAAAFWSLGAGASSVHAQVPDAERPRVGLVLGGGGAKGGAHIGVLKVLEELRIPVDFIAGTSAGAIMGGLYAAGIRPDELEVAVRALDWQSLLTDRAPRNRLTFRRKQDDGATPARFEVGFNDGRFRLPPGLITGQNVETQLRALALPVARVRSFEQLPIPFRAVATDIVTGEMVVLDSGDLATAMRASMSLPGAFAPVDVDGRLLVDGAVVRNLPVDVVRAMGADIVIAVDLSSPLRTRDDLATAFDVSSQVGTIATLANTGPQRALLGDRDILLVPPVDDIQVTDFLRLPETIARGEEIARANIDRLRELSVDLQTYTGYQVRRASYPRLDVRIDSVRVIGSQRLDERVVLGRLGLSLTSDISASDLSAGLERVYGLGLYERVDYRLEPADGGLLLELRLTEKAWGPGYSRFGMAFGTNMEEGSSSFTVLAEHTQTAVNRLGGELRAEARIGEAQALNGSFYQPLDHAGRLFGEAGFYYREELLGLAVAGAGDASRDVDEVGVTLAAGVHTQDWGELRVGILRGRVARKGQGVLVPGDLAAGGLFARYHFDALDERAFPRRGTAGRIEVYRGADALGSDPSYTRLEGGLTAVGSRGDDTWIFHAEAGTSFDDDLPRNHDFYLGGFGRLSGVDPRDVVGNHKLFGSVGYRRRLRVVPSGLAGGNLYGGIALEAGNVWLDSSEVALEGMRVSAVAYVGIETILGPLYMSVAKADENDLSLFLSLGHAF